jgi:hypothetical protein
MSIRRLLRQPRSSASPGAGGEARQRQKGAVISPLLSNIYGHALDALWEKEASHLGMFVRWADDIVILI